MTDPDPRIQQGIDLLEKHTESLDALGVLNLRILREIKAGYVASIMELTQARVEQMVVINNPEVRERIAAILNRGSHVYEWPEDEMSAYRDNGGFSKGRAAVDEIRVDKIIQIVLEGSS